MAATFDEVLLNPEYSALARGGPEFSTAIIEAPASGFKQRNINRADFIGRWAISYDLLTAAALKELYDFFVARRGMAYGFRFVAPEANAVSDAAREQFGTGDGTTAVFNLYRKHTSGPRSYSRRIVKPMAGGLTYVAGSSTIQIYVDNVLNGTATVSSTTGAVTFTSPPANNAVLTWSGEYHVPVCFGSDRFEGQIDIGSTSVFGIELVEMLPVELGL